MQTNRPRPSKKLETKTRKLENNQKVHKATVAKKQEKLE